MGEPRSPDTCLFPLANRRARTERSGQPIQTNSRSAPRCAQPIERPTGKPLTNGKPAGLGYLLLSLHQSSGAQERTPRGEDQSARSVGFSLRPSLFPLRSPRWPLRCGLGALAVGPRPFVTSPAGACLPALPPPPSPLLLAEGWVNAASPRPSCPSSI